MTKSSSRSKIRSCFVSTGRRLDLSPLTSVLDELRVTPVALDNSAVGLAAFEIIAKAIRDADFVIGVLAEPDGNANVLFELGYAHASSKPLLIIGAESANIPADLAGFLYVPNGLTNPEGLRFNVEQLIAAGGRRESRAGRLRRKPAQESRAEINGQTLMRSAALEQKVAAILRRGGAEVVTSSPHSDRGVDLAMWLDEVASFTGGPILVEVRKSVGQPAAIVDHARRYLQQSGAHLALVVYEDGPSSGALNDRFATPSVYFYRHVDLVRDIERSSTAEVIRRLRNRMVHGA